MATPRTRRLIKLGVYTGAAHSYRRSTKKLKTLTVGKCHVRRVEETDYHSLEAIYLAHEGDDYSNRLLLRFRGHDPRIRTFVTLLRRWMVESLGEAVSPDYIP